MTVQSLRRSLEARLRDLPDVTIAKWKDTELVCLFYMGKDFAHFHGETILDIRLSPKIIREEGLDRGISSQIHPDRSKNSRWIGVQFNDQAAADQIVELVKRACAETM